MQKLLALLFITLLLSSCEPGCVEPDQFDTKSEFINSNPESDGIFGDHYDPVSGGQIANWHETGLVSNGEKIVLEISGSWTAWDVAKSDSALKALDNCRICIKKLGVNNCLCQVGETTAAETFEYIISSGQNLAQAQATNSGYCTDVTNPANQDNSNLCTCTALHGTINDQGTYSIALDYQNKDESLKISDEQKECKYSAGSGLYIGFFGSSGYAIPDRVYHVYPTTEVCDVTRDVDGNCTNDLGEDLTKYIYESPEGTVFIKDDHDGNSGNNSDRSNDEYHKAGERIKMIISDRYYSDNYGGYNVTFLGGFIRQEDPGLLEYVVGTFEDAILGKVSADGDSRDGGMLKFLFNSIVKDSAFILILQTFLVLYITIFGIWVLAGALEVTRKELISRVLKIALVLLFTTEQSWYFYNEIVVGLFKDGMDTVIAIFMSITDSAVDTSSNIVISQMERAKSVSNSTRFSYVDVLIQKLFSISVSKKILGLFFSDIFGFIYLIVIYGLIFYFVYVMVFAALQYIQLLLGLIFALSMGPIFTITILFNKTDEIFKRWIAYLASQSIQIIALFAVVYLFATIIDKAFTEMLYYRVCSTNINFGLFNIDFYAATDFYRPITGWAIFFAKIGGLTFLLKKVMEVIPGSIGQLISINGQSIDTTRDFFSASNRFLAGSLLGGAAGLAGGLAGKAGALGYNKAGKARRMLGRTELAKKIGSYSPIRNPVTMMYDRKIDTIINKQKEIHGSGAGADQKIRSGVINEARKQGIKDLGAISNRLDRKLVHEPAKEFIKSEIKKVKDAGNAELFLDKNAMRNHLRSSMENWAKANSSDDSSKFLGLIDDNKFDTLIKERGSIGSSKALEMFKTAEQKARYEAKLHQESGDRKASLTSYNVASALFRNVQGSAAYNPGQTRKNFIAKDQYQAEYENNSVGNKTAWGAVSNYAAFAKKNNALSRRAINYESINQLAETPSDLESKYRTSNMLEDVMLNTTSQIETMDNGQAKDNAMNLLGNYEKDAKNFMGFGSQDEGGDNKSGARTDLSSPDKDVKTNHEIESRDKESAAELKRLATKSQLSKATLDHYLADQKLIQLKSASKPTSAQKSEIKHLESTISELNQTISGLKS